MQNTSMHIWIGEEREPDCRHANKKNLDYKNKVPNNQINEMNKQRSIGELTGYTKVSQHLGHERHQRQSGSVENGVRQEPQNKEELY
jgi:hypothetical protein